MYDFLALPLTILCAGIAYALMIWASKQ